MPTVSAGDLEELPTDRGVAIADGRAVVVRVGDEVFAYRNECLHQASPLDGGLVKDGVLTCPLHFWRYDATTGAKCGEPGLGLEPYPVEVVRGSVRVRLPDPPPARSMREMLLAHARDWNRGD